jgi:hypothetical protein
MAAINSKSSYAVAAVELYKDSADCLPYSLKAPADSNLPL